MSGETNASDSSNDDSANDRVSLLESKVANLMDENDALKEKMKRAEAKVKKLQQKNERLNTEIEKLKKPPQYIATVEEVLDGEGEVVLKQHGNNQEILTEYPQKFNLEAGDRVAVQDSFTPVKILGESQDARTQAMEVDGSPDVTYEDIGGLEAELQEVKEAVEQPLRFQNRFEEVGIEPPSGVLLHGPPGTGKTMMAKAVANQADATFVRLAAPELVQKFIGEGGRLVRDLFDVAEKNAPAIIFVDEIDAIASKRTDSKTSGDAEVQRTLMQFLSSIDGFDNRGDVRVMAATNRFDMLDEALLRPGRFDRLVEVGLPDAEGREMIFQIHARDLNTADDVDFKGLAEAADEFTGAEIAAVCTEAGMKAIRNERTTVYQTDLLEAIEEIDDGGEEEVLHTGTFQ